MLIKARVHPHSFFIGIDVTSWDAGWDVMIGLGLVSIVVYI